LLDLVRLNINLKVKKGRISKLDLKKELKRSNEQDCPEKASKIFSFMWLTRRLSWLIFVFSTLPPMDGPVLVDSLFSKALSFETGAESGQRVSCAARHSFLYKSGGEFFYLALCPRWTAQYAYPRESGQCSVKVC
jgi:hypothetical protein